MSTPIPNHPDRSSQPLPPPPAPPTETQDPQNEAAAANSPLARFLGASATPEDVTKFLQGFLKMFNVMIQQSDAAAKKANAELKKADKGQ